MLKHKTWEGKVWCWRTVDEEQKMGEVSRGNRRAGGRWIGKHTEPQKQEQMLR